MNENAQPRSAAAAYALRAAILAGIAVYIAYLAAAGRLTLYIAPRMAVCVELAALGLYAIAAAQLFAALRSWNARRGREEADEGRSSAGSAWPRRLAVYALFVVPLAVFFLTPDTTIGSAMASRKGMNLSTPVSLKAKSLGAEDAEPPAKATGTGAAPPASGAADTGAGDAAQPVAPAAPPDPLDKLFPYDAYSEVYAKYAKKIYDKPLVTVSEKSYMEILTTLQLYPTAFAGHRASISGFVYRDPAITNDDFVIGRFAIQCCAADALPYGVLVEAPDAATYKDNDWLTITGTLASTKYGDNDVLLLKAEQVEKIKPAKDPYVYADLSFGS